MKSYKKMFADSTQKLLDSEQEVLKLTKELQDTKALLERTRKERQRWKAHCWKAMDDTLALQRNVSKLISCMGLTVKFGEDQFAVLSQAVQTVAPWNGQAGKMERLENEVKELVAYRDSMSTYLKECQDRLRASNELQTYWANLLTEKDKRIDALKQKLERSTEAQMSWVRAHTTVEWAYKAAKAREEQLEKVVLRTWSALALSDESPYPMTEPEEVVNIAQSIRELYEDNRSLVCQVRDTLRIEGDFMYCVRRIAEKLYGSAIT